MNEQYRITVGGNWVKHVAESVPEHSVDIKTNLEKVIDETVLSVIDTHALAYVSALASGNGGLAFEIEHNGPLFEHPVVREAAKGAVSLVTMNTIYYSVVEMTKEVDLKTLSPGLAMTAYNNYGGVTKKQFEMYALATAIIGKCPHCVKTHWDMCKREGMTLIELQHIMKIASVVGAIGKIAI